MIKKGLFGIVIILLGVVCMTGVALAAKEPTVSFDKSTQKFIIENGTENDFGEAYKDMVPGDERTQNFILSNTDSKELKFYFGIDVTQDVDANCKGAVYNIELSCDGEKFYEGMLGGDEGRLVDLSTGALSNDILMAKLGENEKADIAVKIKFDGDTMDNTYQNQKAVFTIKFGASYDEQPVILEEPVPKASQTETPTIIDKVTNVIKVIAPKTGDSTSIVIWSMMCALTVAGIVVLNLRKHTIWESTEEK